MKEEELTTVLLLVCDHCSLLFSILIVIHTEQIRQLCVTRLRESVQHKTHENITLTVKYLNMSMGLYLQIRKLKRRRKCGSYALFTKYA